MSSSNGRIEEMRDLEGEAKASKRAFHSVRVFEFSEECADGSTETKWMRRRPFFTRVETTCPPGTIDAASYEESGVVRSSLALT